jgi:hypothetical protein
MDFEKASIIIILVNVFAFLLSSALVILAIYAAIHFIAKYW